MKKSHIIILLIAAIAAGYLIGNTLKPPIQHIILNLSAPSHPCGYNVPAQPDITS